MIGTVPRFAFQIILAERSWLKLPPDLGPGLHEFGELEAATLPEQLAAFGRTYEVTSIDVRRLAGAKQVRLEFDEAAEIWRFVWLPG